MAFLKRSLHALGYTLADAFDVTDTKQLRTLVVWLEETKIRALPIPDRVALRAIGDDRTWETAFGAYLQELACPRPFRSGMVTADLTLILSWLLSRAVALEYHDQGQCME